jgi:hypothetical protein
MNKYILDEHTPVLCEDVFIWAKWIESADRTVARDEIIMPDGTTITVSTVFLGFDCSWFADPPLVFETLISGFGPSKSGQSMHRRYSTWDEAAAGHVESFKYVQEETA